MTSIDRFLTIAITSADYYPDEAARISQLLESGEVDLVHVRKPSWSAARTESLIREIPEELWSRIKLHDNFRLVEKLGLGGVHLNSRNPIASDSVKSVSRSCHSIEQLEGSEHYDYVTLSPIFDSISKQGYPSGFNLENLKEEIGSHRVVALGGVTPARIPLLKEMGFYGAAMLGYFWPLLSNK